MGKGSGPGHIIDNLPYIGTVALGAWVLYHVHWLLVPLEVLAGILGPLWMMLRVCPHCALYGKAGCPSGYGLVSSRMTRRGDPERFSEAFRRNVASVFPMWFLPIAGVVYNAVMGATIPWVPLVAFVLVAFILVPMKARLYTCARCPKRAECAWGSRAAVDGRRG